MRTLRAGRFAALALLALIAASALAGCGSSGPSTSTASTPAADTTPATTATLPEIGSYTVAAKNTKFISEIRLGSLHYGQAGAPPSEVLSACPGASESAGNAAFAQGELIATYAEGSVPFQVSLNGKGSMAGVGTSNLALHTSAGWTCSGEEIVQFTFQPGQTVAIQFWVLNGEALTNARPRLSQAELNQVSLDLKPFGVWEHEQPTSITVSGPRAATCGSEQGEQHYKLLPYAQLNKGSSGCNKGGGTFTAGG
jgi:predicted small lipoprotein YifL